MNQVPLNTKDIGQEFLNIEKKERSNPLPWNGQFSPQLVEVLLEKYAPRDALVLDPFAGSGTLLHEAAIHSIAAVAADINPAACYLATVHTLANRDASFRESLIAQVDDHLPKLIVSDLPLFDGPGPAPLDIGLNLSKRMRDIFRSPEAIQLVETLFVLSEFWKEGHGSRVAYSTWKKLRVLIRDLPYSSKSLTALNCDARHLPIPDASIGLVVTSPPYINVFNYHQNYRSSTEAFGWNLLSVAKSEIGSNRKNRGNRFLTVIQYCLDLSQVFDELVRVCNENCRIIFVVGRESRVLGIPFYNGRMIGSLATEAASCKLITRQERVFRNRFGQSIYEDILHFIPGSREAAPSLERARAIARQTLEDCLQLAPQNTILDLKDAIERLAYVHPSPIYDPQASRISTETGGGRH